MDRASELLSKACAGDEAAFEALVAPWRSRLLTLCYQMLGSVDEAEDVMQETLIRAWKGIGRFEGKSEIGTWLQAIAANRCLTAVERRRNRALPMDYGPPAAVGEPTGDPLAGDRWIDPFPEQTDTDTERLGPSARYERRESVELAFIAAVHHLSANQRAVLLLRDVLGFSAKETADALDTTPGSVTSALQRARRRIEDRLPRRSQQATLQALGDEHLSEIVKRYGEAWETGDVNAVVALLSEDASFAMPPLRTWFKGREAISRWLSDEALSGRWRWRQVRLQANGQVALAFYGWDESDQSYLAFALKILGFDGDRISSVTSFIVRDVREADAEALAWLVAEPIDPSRTSTVFGRFGLPDRIR